MTHPANSKHKSPLLQRWERFSKLPGGNRLFSLLLGRFTPYSGSIRARVIKVDAGYARVIMRDRRRVRNHLNSIHAIALINLGEIATGLAVLSTLSEEMRGIVVSIKADYVKKARGDLVAEASFKLAQTIDDNSRYEVQANLCDLSGEIVTIVTATWLIGYNKK